MHIGKPGSETRSQLTGSIEGRCDLLPVSKSSGLRWCGLHKLREENSDDVDEEDKVNLKTDAMHFIINLSGQEKKFYKII